MKVALPVAMVTTITNEMTGHTCDVTTGGSLFASFTGGSTSCSFAGGAVLSFTSMGGILSNNPFLHYCY